MATANRAKYTLKVCRQHLPEVLQTVFEHKYYCLMENSLFKKKSPTWSVGFVMDLAFGHSAQSVFAKGTNTKQKNSYQNYQT